MTAGEDQAQPVVGDTAVVAAQVAWGLGRGRLLLLGRPGPGPAQLVEHPVAGRGGEPGAGIARDAVVTPTLQRPGEGVLGALLGQIPVPGQPDERGYDASPLGPEGAGDGRLRVCGYISQIGLTSIVPTLAPGILDATSMASSRSLQSTT